MKPPISYRKSAKDREVMMGFQTFKDHQGMAERLKKTLYYGKHPKTDRPSLSMTELAVEFFSKAVPEGLGKIDMDYAAAVSRSACISPCSMILAMAYIERLRCRSSDYLMQVSSSDLFLVSMMVASKFLYDEGEDEEVFNDEWALAANLDNKEVNQLERNFLKAVDWNVYMNQDLFEDLLYDVEYKIAIEKSRDRGWCTYTDLLVLSNHMKAVQCWQLLLDSVIKVVAISSIAYAASAAAMVGAVVLARHATQRTQLMIADDTTDELAFSQQADNMAFVSESFNSFDNLTAVPCMFCDRFVYGSCALSNCYGKSSYYQNSHLSTSDPYQHKVSFFGPGPLSSEILGPLLKSQLPCYSSAWYIDESHFEGSNEFWELRKKQLLVTTNGSGNHLEAYVGNDVTSLKLCNSEKNSSKMFSRHRAKSEPICIATTGFAFR